MILLLNEAAPFGNEGMVQRIRSIGCVQMISDEYAASLP